MTTFLAQAIIFIIFLIFACIVSVPVVKQMSSESKQKKEEAAEFKRRQAAITGKSNLTRLQRFKQNLLYNIDVIKMPRQVFLILEVGAVVLGFIFGKIVFTSTGLALASVALFVTLPAVFVLVRASWYKQNEAGMLENCMVMITSSYRSTRDIVKAFKDNVNKNNVPVAFKNFVSDVTFVDSNVERALRKVGAAFNNRYFDEWIEVLIKAQHDSTMMDILPSIIDEMDEAKKAQSEASAAMKKVWREYITWVITCICVPLVLRVNEEWYNALVYTVPGKVLVIALIAGLINSLRVMLKINSRPIDV